MKYFIPILLVIVGAGRLRAAPDSNTVDQQRWVQEQRDAFRDEEDRRDIIVSELADGITQRTFVAIMEFKTATRQMFRIINQKFTDIPVESPVTGTTGDSTGSFTFHIEGQFHVVAAIRSGEPALGAVNVDAPVKFGRHGGNAVYQRLEGLIPGIGGRDPEAILKTAQNYLVIGPVGEKDLTKLQFLGPFPSDQVDGIARVARRLLAKDLDKLTDDEAKALLSANDPWLRALGKVRLDPGCRPIKDPDF